MKHLLHVKDKAFIALVDGFEVELRSFVSNFPGRQEGGQALPRERTDDNVGAAIRSYGVEQPSELHVRDPLIKLGHFVDADVHARVRRLNSRLNLPCDSTQTDSHLLSQILEAFAAVVEAVQVHRGHIGLERPAKVVHDLFVGVILLLLLVLFDVHVEVAADECAVFVKIVFVEQNLPL